MMAEKNSQLCAEIKKFSIQSAHLSNYHISLWRKVFLFIFNQSFYIYIKDAHCFFVVKKNPAVTL
jgi:hypothetical protein